MLQACRQPLHWPPHSLVLELVDLVPQAAQRQEGVAAAKGGGGARQVRQNLKLLVQHLCVGWRMGGVRVRGQAGRIAQ